MRKAPVFGESLSAVTAKKEGLRETLSHGGLFCRTIYPPPSP